MINRYISFCSAILVLALVAVPARSAGRGGGHAAARSHSFRPANMHMANMHMANMHMANVMAARMRAGTMPHVITPRFNTPTFRTPRLTKPVIKSAVATSRVSRGPQRPVAGIVATSNLRNRFVRAPHHHHLPHSALNYGRYGFSLYDSRGYGGGGYGGGGYGGGGYGGDESPYDLAYNPYSNLYFNPYSNPNSNLYFNPYAVNSVGIAAAADQTQAQAKPARQVEVIVPDPSAEVWFNGTKASKLGGRRYFPVAARPSPEAATVKATWSVAGQTTTIERNVNIGAGANLVVDLTKPPTRP